MLKHPTEIETRLTDLEGWSRRENSRIHGVKEGSEDDAQLMVAFVERLLRDQLERPDSAELRGFHRRAQPVSRWKKDQMYVPAVEEQQQPHLTPYVLPIIE